jgi:hypothetical protein
MMLKFAKLLAILLMVIPPAIPLAYSQDEDENESKTEEASPKPAEVNPEKAKRDEDYAKSLEAARAGDSGVGPCSAECQKRVAVGDIWIKGQGAAADEGAKRIEETYKNNVRSCRNGCVTESTTEGCNACAAKVITDEKLAQDKAEFDKYACPVPQDAAGCTVIAQPVFKYKTEPASAKPGCVQACGKRFPFDGMKLLGDIAEAQKIMQQFSMEKFTPCITKCSGKADSECDACAAQQITDEEIQAKVAEINEKYGCDRPRDQSVGQAVVDALGIAPPTLCTIINFSPPTVKQN